MPYGIRYEAWGDYALFSRPEFKVERVSYDVMTPSAARGILESVYWHPGMRWLIDRIFVCNPIIFTNVRRNEVKSKILASQVFSAMQGSCKELYIASSEDIQQRASMVLKDVRYVIDAHFEMTAEAAPGDNEGKFCEIARRRLEKGQFYSKPYFGCREFPAHCRLFDSSEVKSFYADAEKDLGWMLYDMDYSDRENITPMFFRAAMKNGCLDLTQCEVVK